MCPKIKNIEPWFEKGQGKHGKYFSKKVWKIACMIK